MATLENILAWVLRKRVRLQAAPVVQLLNLSPFVLAFSAAATLVVVALQRVLQPPSSRGNWIAVLAVLLLLTAAALFAALRGLRGKSDSLRLLETRHPLITKVAVLSTQIGIALLPVIAFIAVWESPYDRLEWPSFGYVNKRYLLALYWLVIFTCLLLPPVLWRALSATRVPPSHPTTHGRARPASSTRAPRGWSLRIWSYAGILLALVIAAFMYGPPWNLSGLPLNVNWHEQVHLNGLQAIEKGYLPNTDAAAQLYGPGFQLSMYGFMRLTGQFTLLGFRQSQAAISFVAFTLLALIAFRVLQWPYALLAVFFSLTASPFSSIPWTENGSLYIWGWPNPLRMMGSLLLVLLLPSALLSKTRRPLKLAAVGWIWGLFTWYSPENLLMGAASAAMLCVLLWSTETIEFKRILTGIALVALGALLFWAPIAVYYHAHGLLAQYFSNAFQGGSKVLTGAQNTFPAPDVLQSPFLNNISLFALPLLIFCGLSVLFRNMTLSRRLEGRAILLLGLISVTLSNMFGYLTRSDASHLTSTLIAFPILLGMLIQDLPGLWHLPPPHSLFAKVILATIVLMFVSNWSKADLHWYARQFEVRLARYFSPAAQTVNDGLADGVALARSGYGAIPASAMYSVQPSVPAAELFGALDEIHSIAGERPVYVHSFPYSLSGLVYFLADVVPQPLPDLYSMVRSEEDRARFVERFEGIAGQVDYIVTTDRKIPELDSFLAAHPDATYLSRALSDRPYFIYGVFQTVAVP